VLELPEVEVLRKDLEKEVVGKRIKDALVMTPSVVTAFHRTRPDFSKLLEGRKITAVRRRGTVLFIDLDEPRTWIVDPGATGSLHRATSTEKPGKDTHWIVTFTIGGAIHGTDPIRGGGGRMGVVPTPDTLALAGLSPDAIDPLEDNPTWPDFLQVLKAAAGPLKSVLQDETLILGVGEVYSDEVLWEAGLRYDRQSHTLTEQEVRRMYRALQEVMHAAIKQRGSSLDEPGQEESIDEDGVSPGHIRVYGRDGRPCLRCRHTIVKTKLKKRSVTYYCEQCQM